MTLQDIRHLLAQRLPYFLVEAADEDGRWHIRYNGEAVASEDWELFEAFTSTIGFPLDFSSSIYVGVSVPHAQFVEAVEALPEQGRA